MVYLRCLILGILLTIKFTSSCQCVSPNPYELLWNRFGIEQDSLFVAEHKISNIRSLRVVKLKNGEVRKARQHYEIEFNTSNLPTKYTYYLEFGLRKDYRYNPFWRLKNDYPVYNIWTYNLNYDSLDRLAEIHETKHHTNYPQKFYKKINSTMIL